MSTHTTEKRSCFFILLYKLKVMEAVKVFFQTHSTTRFIRSCSKSEAAQLQSLASLFNSRSNEAAFS